MEKLTFIPLSEANDRVVANIRRKMLARRRKAYETPATEQTCAVTNRTLGEKDDE